jgi:hypothetical protein
MNCNLRMNDSIERIFRESMAWHSVEFFVMLEQNLVGILAEYGWQIIFLTHPHVIHVLDPLLHLLLMLLNHYPNNHWFHYKRSVFFFYFLRIENQKKSYSDIQSKSPDDRLCSCLLSKCFKRCRRVLESGNGI